MVDSQEIWKLLTEVSDPEVPVLSVLDLGVVRSVNIEGEHIHIQITPTYSGCPAMRTIEKDVIQKLKENGFDSVVVEEILSPAWTTDWISEEGREKLRSYGIAPPEHEPDKTVLFSEPVSVTCPKCSSKNTTLVSIFGSTACKAHYKCNDCLEPFDYFKCLR